MQIQRKIQEIQPSQCSELLYYHFPNLMSEFYEMQSSFLSGLYKRYKNIETANIILCFLRNINLEILRQREKNLDFNISLENFWSNINNINKPSQKIISIVNATGIPKETTRRKLKNLINKDFVKIDKNTKEYYWNLSLKNKDAYYKFINLEIKILSKFVLIFSTLFKIKLNQNEIENEIKSQFSFYWYHFLSCQLKWLKMWQNKIKDIDLLLITLQTIIPTMQHTDTKRKLKDFESTNEIIKKISEKHKHHEIAVSATSISDITGITRPTCIRKLGKLVNNGLLLREKKTKRYFINPSTINRAQNILTKENVNFTISVFSEYLSIVINALQRNRR